MIIVPTNISAKKAEFFSHKADPGNTVASTHQSGDLIIAFIISNGFTPHMPPGWTNMGATTSIMGAQMRGVWKIATSSSETCVSDYSSMRQYFTVKNGKGVGGFASTNTPYIGGINLTNSGGGSVVIGCVYDGNGNSPSVNGWTLRSLQYASYNNSWTLNDTAVSSVPSVATVNTAMYSGMGMTVEIIP